jgi:hypothetical protein
MPASLLRRVAAVVCLVVFVMTPLALGQGDDDGPVMQAGPFALPYSARSLAAMTRIVGLDKDQAASARALHQGYRAAYGAAAKKVRQKEEELSKKAQETGDWQNYSKDNGTLVMGFIEETRKLESGLLEDFKALCTPAQAAKFAEAERARRRETGLLVALGTGERVDLVAMFDALKIDRHAPAALDELVTHWEADVDRLLVEKDKTIRDGMKSAMMGERAPETMAKMAKFMNDLAALCARIGETNRRAATEAAGLIPEGKRGVFEDEVKERSFPRIYGPSPVSKTIKTALELKGLSEDQKSKLQELGEAYKRDAGPVNARWAAAAEEKQRQLQQHMMEMMNGREPQDESDPFYAVRKERRALDEKYIGKIGEVLTAEQKDQLPKADHGARDIPEYLPDFEADFKGEWDRWQEEGK